MTNPSGTAGFKIQRSCAEVECSSKLSSDPPPGICWIKNHVRATSSLAYGFDDTPRMRKTSEKGRGRRVELDMKHCWDDWLLGSLYIPCLPLWLSNLEISTTTRRLPGGNPLLWQFRRTAVGLNKWATLWHISSRSQLTKTGINWWWVWISNKLFLRKYPNKIWQNQQAAAMFMERRQL